MYHLQKPLSFALRTYISQFSFASILSRDLRNNNCFKVETYCNWIFFLRWGSRVDRFRSSRPRRWQPHWSSRINHGWKSPTLLIQNAQVTAQSPGSESWHGNSVHRRILWRTRLNSPDVWPQSSWTWGHQYKKFKDLPGKTLLTSMCTFLSSTCDFAQKQHHARNELTTNK